jgi:hypothetical protein
MSFEDRLDVEGFLIEDVILTLGNVRLSLTWLAADADGGSGGAWRRSGIDRLDRQLSQLEDRARALRSAEKERPVPGDCDVPVVFRTRRKGTAQSRPAGR